MKVKAKPKQKRNRRRIIQPHMEEAMKTIAGLEVIQADLVHHENGTHELAAGADLLKRIVKSSEGQPGTGGQLIIKVVHVNDRGERIEPTEQEKELDRKIEGRHHEDD